MCRILLLGALLLAPSGSALAQSPAPDAAGLTTLLNEFLAGAGPGDLAMHDRFWADDLIYTRASGLRIGKADVLRDVRARPAPKAGDPRTVYTAEDVRIQQYGDTAVVAFRLVGTTTGGGDTVIAKFLNTGTFHRRNGEWRAVAWQATRLARNENEIRKEVAAAETAFHQAMLAGDVTKLEALLDPTFVRTFRDGSRQARQEALEEIATGQLKFTQLETRDVAIDVYGDAAVARGTSLRQRAAVPGAEPDVAPFEFFYTMTLANQGGTWKVVALHSSHP